MSATQLELEDVHATRPERKGLRKGLYLIPSAFTAANIGMGYFAVMGALHGFKLLEGGTEVELNRAAQHFDSAARLSSTSVPPSKSLKPCSAPITAK